MVRLEEMTLEEIKKLRKPRLITYYEKEIKKLSYNRLTRAIVEKNYGSSLEDIYYLIEEIETDYISDIYFPGETIIMYPNIKERRAKKQITCDFSAGIILPGSLYINYRPMLKNINNDLTYVLKRTMKVETGYEYNLPTNIQELESLAIKVRNNSNNEIGIDYSHLSESIGGDFIFQQLQNKRRKR